jgi:tetratricopeptide (TPR) repeat protein
MRAALIALALVALAPTVSADGQVVKALTPAEKLREARQLFRGKEWRQSLGILKDLLYPTSELSRREDVVEVHMLLGSCHVQLGERADAVKEYELALDLDFERGMNEELYPEAAIKLLEETRERMRENRAAEAKRKEIAEREKRLKEYIDTIGVYEKRSFTQNFVPFGWPQSQNGHKTKAVIVGSGQAVSFAVSAGAWVYLAAKYGLQARVPREDGPSVRRIQQIEIGAALTFFALYGYSVIDGMIYFEPTKVIKGDDSIRDLLDLDKPPPTPKAKPRKTSFRNSFRFGPLLSPTGVGIGVAWETD